MIYHALLVLDILSEIQIGSINLADLVSDVWELSTSLNYISFGYSNLFDDFHLFIFNL
jgi:hypothetical protein